MMEEFFNVEEELLDNDEENIEMIKYFEKDCSIN
jgi:hypothetical protein